MPRVAKAEAARIRHIVDEGLRLLKIATWNIELTKSRPAMRAATVLDALAGRQHGVLVMTESEVTFSPSPGLRLAGSSIDAPDRGGDRRWVCIWVTDKIECQPLELQAEPERSAATLLLFPDRTQAIVFGTVLPWRSDPRRGAKRGGENFIESLTLQAADVARLRVEYPDARFWLLGDLNQEIDRSGPVGTSLGRNALSRFLNENGLVAVTGGLRDPLRAAGWRDSIDHICLDEMSAATVSGCAVWPEEYPLPGASWPDHHGVEILMSAW